MPAAWSQIPPLEGAPGTRLRKGGEMSDEVRRKVTFSLPFRGLLLVLFAIELLYDALLLFAWR